MATPTLDQMSITDLDKQSFIHPFTSLAQNLKVGPKVMAQARGIYVSDLAGKEFIDAMAGLWCVNIGWGHEEMADAIADQVRQLSYFHSFAGMGTEPSIRLASKVTQLTPGNLNKIFFGNSGSDANDTNVKLVWYYNNLRGKPQKKKIISRQRAYHGVTVAAASLTGLESLHKAFDIPLPQIRHAEAPHYYRNADPDMTERDFSTYLAGKLEALILEEGPETVAAFIAEPIQGAGGVIVPPEGYFEAIQPVLKKYEVLLIADEVICGFGRCGTWFGSQYFHIAPDIMTIAKGLTSGYIPMSGSIISDDIWEILVDGSEEVGAFAHGYTYTAHPVAAAAGLANIGIMERLNLVENAETVGAYFQQKLRAAFSEHPLVGEVRGVGLIAAIEFVKDRTTKETFDSGMEIGSRMAKLCMDEGLICRSLPMTTAMAFSPPLVLTTEEADEIIERFSRALDQLTVELSREGIV